MAAPPPSVESLQEQMEALAARDPRLAKLMGVAPSPREAPLLPPEAPAPMSAAEAAVTYAQLAGRGPMLPRQMWPFIEARAAGFEPPCRPVGSDRSHASSL